MAAKAALNGLANYADEGGTCWPSIHTLAKGAGCSDNTMRRAIQRLVDLALVERQPRAGSSDIYRLNIGRAPSHVGTPPKAVPLPTKPAPLPTRQGTPPTVDVTPPTVGAEPSEPLTNRQGTTNEQPFKLPGDWQPSQACRDHATDKGLDSANVTEAFTDYFCNGRGKREKRTGPGWEKRFRVWCNTDADRKRPAGGVRSPSTGGDAGAFARAAARLGRD
jgi:hypothetical protein